MKNNVVITFDNLLCADLIIDTTYEGGTKGHAGDEPLTKLLGCENQGGFRPVGARNGIDTNFCVLYTELINIDWPDEIEVETGKFHYYGDNRNPGTELHNTPKKGNVILRFSYNQLHKESRENIPPFFIFTKGSKGRDKIFRGLAVPGAPDLNETEDLIAIWKLKDGKRFQNYKAVFTILDVPTISRAWINDLQNGQFLTSNAPSAWVEWVKTGKYDALIAKKTIEYRTKQEQLPTTKLREELVQCVINFFKNHPLKEYAFEKCAARLAQMMDNNIIECDLTRPWRDGGRDALGKYKIGMHDNAIYVDFALEAKCKQFTSGSGVKETSRLIARLRHRQFGIFITTSYINKQAYQEIKVDGHPVIIISGDDIGKILESRGLKTVKDVKQWLEKEFL